MKTEAVFFDFWETLFGFLTQEELQKVRRERIEGFSRILCIPSAKIEDAFFRLMEEINKERNSTGIEITLYELLERLLRMLKVKTEVEPLWRIYTEAVYKKLPGPLPGAVDLLKELKRKNIKQVIISNTIHGHIERRLLEIHKLNDHFDLCLFSSEVRFRKPRKEIFEIAIKKLNVRPQMVLHVGDSPETDVLGAYLAGVWSVYYDPEKRGYPDDLPPPNFVISHLYDVLEIIE